MSGVLAMLEELQKKIMKARSLTLTLGAAKLGENDFSQYAGLKASDTDQVDSHLLLVDLLDDIFEESELIGNAVVSINMKKLQFNREMNRPRAVRA